jgi:hypothetical protein
MNSFRVNFFQQAEKALHAVEPMLSGQCIHCFLRLAQFFLKDRKQNPNTDLITNMKKNLLKTIVVAGLVAMSTNLFAFTAVTSGAWTSATTWGGLAPGSTVSNQDIIIPSGITVDLDVDVDFSGLLNTFDVDGTLENTANHSVTISTGTFTGSGMIDIDRLTFDGILVTSTFNGTLTLNTLRNNGPAITLTGNSTVADSLLLDAGSTILGTGGNLTMEANAVVRVDDGTLTSTGGLFNTGNGYHVWYVGTSKTTGLEVNSSNLQDLHVNLDNNTSTLTQGLNQLRVNGTLHLTMGEYAINGNELILEGDLNMSNNSTIVSTATSDLTIEGTGAMTDDIEFATGSSIGDLTIDRMNGDIGITGDLAVAGAVYLTNGNLGLESGANLTMNAGSMIRIANGSFMQNGGTFTGTASYDVEYAGSTVTSNVELTGSGLNDVTVNLTSSSSMVRLDDNVTVNGLLDMQTGMLSLEGNDLTLDGTLDQESDAMFKGDSTSQLTLNLTTSVNDTIWFDGSGQHLDRFELNIPAAGMLVIGTGLTIHDAIDMNGGRLGIMGDLTLRSVASVNNYNEDRYIATLGSGRVAMHIQSNAAFMTFPVGTEDEYTPAKIQQTSNAGMFMVRVMEGVYTNGTTGFNSAITEPVVDKTWMIEAGSAVNVNMNLKLGWVASAEVNGFDRTTAYITHYTNNDWDFYLSGSAVSAANNTYEITRTGITSLSPFAVVDTAAVLAVEENNTMNATINVYPNPTADFVNIAVATEGNDVLQYQLFDATGKVISTVQNADKLNQVDLSNLANGYYFIKITNLSNNTYVTKRIVKS